MFAMFWCWFLMIACTENGLVTDDSSNVGDSVPGWSAIAVGYDFGCVLGESNQARCWGNIAAGSLDMVPSDEFISLTAGFFHVCGLRSDGNIVCWGSDSYGQSSFAPGLVSNVAAGGHSTCAINDRYELRCSDEFSAVVPADNAGYTEVAVGLTFVCASGSTGDTQCWSNAGTDFTIAGSYHGTSMLGLFACGLTEQGAIYCWTEGELDSSLTPPSYQSAVQVSAGNGHACALFEDGTSTCWGSNEFGESNVPQVTLSAIAAGSDFSCGLAADTGEIICWGDNSLSVVSDHN
ncbi:MAG: hypothetical protein HY565_02955 [Candidatus Kerfeldbacteria bacterium]|nr:hypothetical protein [Candidatus Kerfeldbacteria bacterium]